uniref:Uncharacterized protein n=1 Tax=Cacopsylla melanoneura TaxID=428564 RepID=A0A8D8TT03_9HEMI
MPCVYSVYTVILQFHPRYAVAQVWSNSHALCLYCYSSVPTPVCSGSGFSVRLAVPIKPYNPQNSALRSPKQMTSYLSLDHILAPVYYCSKTFGLLPMKFQSAGIFSKSSVCT